MFFMLGRNFIQSSPTFFLNPFKLRKQYLKNKNVIYIILYIQMLYRINMVLRFKNVKARNFPLAAMSTVSSFNIFCGVITTRSLFRRLQQLLF